MTGWKIPGALEDRIFLYADDILLFISNHKEAGPRVLEFLGLFGEASGLNVNRDKSLLVLVCGDKADEDWAGDIPVRQSSFRYLGLTISLDPDMAWAHNITPLVLKMLRDLDRWSKLETDEGDTTLVRDLAVSHIQSGGLPHVGSPGKKYLGKRLGGLPD